MYKRRNYIWCQVRMEQSAVHSYYLESYAKLTGCLVMFANSGRRLNSLGNMSVSFCCLWVGASASSSVTGLLSAFSFFVVVVVSCLPPWCSTRRLPFIPAISSLFKHNTAHASRSHAHARIRTNLNIYRTHTCEQVPISPLLTLLSTPLLLCTPTFLSPQHSNNTLLLAFWQSTLPLLLPWRQ